jgi:predicted PurR-regulated permease PerM
MAGLTHVLRGNAWAAIAASLLVTAGLTAIGQTQLAALLACIAGILLMWKSEIDNPSRPPDPDEP